MCHFKQIALASKQRNAYFCYMLLKKEKMPSTVINTFTYDPASQKLRIKFLTGKIYDYFKVPETVYMEMKNAFSKGIFFSENIRNKYGFEMVGDEGNLFK